MAILSGAGVVGEKPLVAVMGATASGKTALALALAERFGGEIVSCDSLAVYRGMDVGTAKPSAEERARVLHHCLDFRDPPEGCTAGDWARVAAAAVGEISTRGRLPIIAGGTGLYLRALLDGLFAGPAADEALRDRLRARVARRGPSGLHSILRRLDPEAAGAIHPNDVPKVIRAVEIALLGRRPMSELWGAGREGLQGYRVLRLWLRPERAELYGRINARAEGMFRRGLVEEMRGLVARWGWGPRAFGALGYKEAGAVLRGEMTEVEAAVAAQQGHRNYAKRQETWFRKEAGLHETAVLAGVGEQVVVRAEELVAGFLG